MLFVTSLLTIILLYFGISSAYLLVFAVAGKFYRSPTRLAQTTRRRMAVLIPAYREDAVIVSSARHALHQSYPREWYDVIVIADSLQLTTLRQLRELPVHIIPVQFDVSTKANALNAALRQLPDYDVALVLDADNVMEYTFLEKINAAFHAGCIAVQGHRTAKNTDTSVARLDAISEEINNHIFRKGHRALGLSAALIGSGMAFDYRFFRNAMAQIDAINGFDKALELHILQTGHRIAYADDALVYDEKVASTAVFRQQRTRWLAAQFHFARTHFFAAWQHVWMNENWDFFDKVMQFLLPPRLMLIGGTGIGFIASVALQNRSLIILSTATGLALGAALLLSVPTQFFRKLSVRDAGKLPALFVGFLLALLRIRQARKRFIHTPHGNHS